MIIFDTKGDFYNEFYTPGDVVISNDSTSTGSGELDYWNIFNEIEPGEHMLESVIEISKSLFCRAVQKHKSNLFSECRKRYFYGLCASFYALRCTAGKNK